MFEVAKRWRRVLYRGYALEALRQRQREESGSGEHIKRARALLIGCDQSLKFIYQKAVRLKERARAHAKVAAVGPVLQNRSFPLGDCQALSRSVRKERDARDFRQFLAQLITK